MLYTTAITCMEGYDGAGALSPDRSAVLLWPLGVLAMLLLSFLYNISERQTEDLVNSNRVAKCAD